MTISRRGHDLDQVRRWAVTAARAADAKKAEDTVVLEVAGIIAITDAFVITSAPNDRMVRAIAQEVEAKVGAGGGPRPLRIEGLDDARWVLMDYGDFVVHVFVDEVRRYYELERLWTDAPRIEWVPASPAAAAGGE